TGVQTCALPILHDAASPERDIPPKQQRGLARRIVGVRFCDEIELLRAVFLTHQVYGLAEFAKPACDGSRPLVATRSSQTVAVYEAEHGVGRRYEACNIAGRRNDLPRFPRTSPQPYPTQQLPRRARVEPKIFRMESAIWKGTLGRKWRWDGSSGSGSGFVIAAPGPLPSSC